MNLRLIKFSLTKTNNLHPHNIQFRNSFIFYFFIQFSKQKKTQQRNILHRGGSVKISKRPTNEVKFSLITHIIIIKPSSSVQNEKKNTENIFNVGAMFLMMLADIRSELNFFELSTKKSKYH